MLRNNKSCKTNIKAASEKAKVFLAMALSCIILVLPGCEAPPTDDDIVIIYDEQLAALRREQVRRHQVCEDLYGKGTDEFNTCTRNVEDWYDKMWELLQEARDEAQRKNWEHARELQDEWHRKLREMMPDFPDIRDITEPLWNGLMNIEATGISVGRPLYIANPTIYEVEISSNIRVDQYQFNGTASLDSPNLEATLDLDASIIIQRDLDDQSGVFGQLKGGAFVGTAFDGTTITLTVVNDSANTIVVDEYGVGFMTVLTTMEHSHEAWNAILPYYNRIRLPVSIGDDDSIIISTNGWVPTGEYVPYIPWPCSDYNLDGVLDYETDFAAYMVDFDIQFVLADTNYDGYWNDADIDLWTIRFLEDYDQMNN